FREDVGQRGRRVDGDRCVGAVWCLRLPEGASSSQQGERCEHGQEAKGPHEVYTASPLDAASMVSGAGKEPSKPLRPRSSLKTARCCAWLAAIRASGCF